MRISDWSSDVCSSDLAFAQDEADKGMYFQLRTGVADLNNPDLAIIATWSEPNNRLETKRDTKSAATLGGELGYGFGGVRVGPEQNGRAHVRKPVNNTKLVGSLLMEKKKQYRTSEM